MIGSLYRSPNRASLGFDGGFETLLQTIDSNYRGYTVILAGDMNFDLLRNKNVGVQSFLNFLFSYGLALIRLYRIKCIK